MSDRGVTLLIACAYCGKKSTVDAGEFYQGMELTCPHCGGSFTLTAEYKKEERPNERRTTEDS